MSTSSKNKKASKKTIENEKTNLKEKVSEKINEFKNQVHAEAIKQGINLDQTDKFETIAQNFKSAINATKK